MLLVNLKGALARFGKCTAVAMSFIPGNERYLCQTDTQSGAIGNTKLIVLPVSAIRFLTICVQHPLHTLNVALPAYKAPPKHWILRMAKSLHKATWSPEQTYSHSSWRHKQGSHYRQHQTGREPSEYMK